jgi:hypothetical protein
VIREVGDLLAVDFVNAGIVLLEVHRLELRKYLGTALVLQSMAPLIKPFLAGSFIFRMKHLSKFYQVLFGVPKIKNAGRFGKEAAKHLLQTRTAIG